MSDFHISLNSDCNASTVSFVFMHLTLVKGPGLSIIVEVFIFFDWDLMKCFEFPLSVDVIDTLILENQTPMFDQSFG